MKFVRYRTHAFLTSALVGGEWSASHPGLFTPGERSRYPLDWRLVGPENWFGCPYRDSNSDPSVVQPIASRYGSQRGFVTYISMCLQTTRKCHEDGITFTAPIIKHCQFSCESIPLPPKSQEWSTLARKLNYTCFIRYIFYIPKVWYKQKVHYICNNSVAVVRERTIPTERAPFVDEVSANFFG
jgi:hypothetical protein